jgi:hypothetical protein
MICATRRQAGRAAVLLASLAIAAALAVALAACSGAGGARSARQAEGEAVYKLVIERAEGYDGGKISACVELVVEPIDANNLYLIKKGIKRFTADFENAIADYNGPDSGDSAKALRRANKTSKDNFKYRLSKVGFNERLDYAVLYELDNINPDLGHGSFIFLRKDGGAWVIDSEVMK